MNRMKKQSPAFITGRDLVRGAVDYLATLAAYIFLGACAIQALANFLDWGVDDTDQDGWRRSGLKVHTDAKTGIQYLSDGNGGLIRRENDLP